MTIGNNISISQNTNIVQQNAFSKIPEFQTTPYYVDYTTTTKDKVQLSTTQKIGIGAAIVASIVALTCLLKGKKPPKNITKPVQDIIKESPQIVQNSKPKMQMTAEAKKIYNSVDKTLHKPNSTSVQTIERNLAPKIKKGSWDSKDMKAFYTQLEKESEAKIKAEKVFREKLQFSEKYVKDNMQKLDEQLCPNGTLQIDRRYNRNDVLIEKRISLDELIKPHDEFVDYIYHGTSVSAKENILKEGFNPLIKPQHGYLDGVGGTYFAFNPNTGYGDAVIKAKFKGKVADVDSNLLNNITDMNHFNIVNLLKKDGYTYAEAQDLAELISKEYLKQKIIQKGFVGIKTTNFSHQAGCQYFSALDPKFIEIIE